MTNCYNRFKKNQETELLFSGFNISKNFLYNELIILSKKNLIKKYLEFFSKENIYILIQNIFQKRVFETLTNYSFFFKSKYLRLFSKVFFFYLNYFFFYPKYYLLLMSISKTFMFNIKIARITFTHLSQTNLIRNWIVRDNDLFLILSYLEIKDFKVNNKAYSNNTQLLKTFFIFNFERITYKKKNEKISSLLFKLGIFFYTCNSNLKFCYKINLWLVNALFLNIIKGTKLEKFWIFLRTFSKKFYNFSTLDNFYQLFLPVVGLEKKFKQSIDESSYIFLCLKLNTDSLLRIMSTILTNRNYNFFKILFLFFFRKLTMSINIDNPELSKFLIVCQNLSKKVETFRWFICKLDRINLTKKRMLIQYYSAIVKVFFKNSIDEKLNIGVHGTTNFLYGQTCLTFEKSLIFFPKKITLQKDWNNNKIKKILYIRKDSSIFLNSLLSLKKREIYNNYSNYKPSLKIQLGFKNINLKNTLVFLKYSNNMISLRQTWIFELIISFWIIYFSIKKKISENSQFSIFFFLYEYYPKKSMKKSNNSKNKVPNEIIPIIDIRYNLINQRHNFKYFGKKGTFQKKKVLFVRYNCSLKKLPPKSQIFFNRIHRNIIKIKYWEKFKILYTIKFFIKIFYNFLLKYILRSLFNNYFRSFFRDTIHLRNSIYTDTFNNIIVLGRG